MNGKSIVWLFPGPDYAPVGGYKTVYEYSNRFVADGWNVSIVYPQHTRCCKKSNVFYRALKLLYDVSVYLCNLLKKKDFRPIWFSLDECVKCEYVFNFKKSKAAKIKGANFIATALFTAFELDFFKKNSEQKTYYFVQDFESWWTQNPDDVYESYKLPLKKITIAPWLVKEIESVESSATLIENGLDFEYFKLVNPIETRSKFEVAMLYHTAEIKRAADAIDALRIVKEKIPELHVTMFGVPDKPDVPEWFDYFKQPDKETHNNIYNKAAVFVAPSRLEGMGLTPAESMMCGCAVACTDNPGFDIFSRNNETTLVSKAMDVEGLAENIIKLIQDDNFRIRIAKNGNNFIQQFTWENAFNKFKDVLKE